MKYNKIGVAVPLYNGLEYVENCIRSINDQTIPVKAYIVEDCSTETSREGFSVYEFLQHRKNNLLKGHSLAKNEENLGWPKTLNRAVEMATKDGCDLVFVMNADDWLRIDAIESMYRFMELGEYDWVNCWGQQVGEENTLMVSEENAKLEDFKERTVLTNWALMRSEVWQALGGYAEDLRVDDDVKAGYEDWEFWIRAVKSGYRYGVVRKPLYYYRMHQGQLHRRTTAQDDRARKLILERHNLI